jgi:hypothetical protein
MNVGDQWLNLRTVVQDVLKLSFSTRHTCSQASDNKVLTFCERVGMQQVTDYGEESCKTALSFC